MVMSALLFTPEGESPALASLKLETLGARDQLTAVSEALGQLSLEEAVHQIKTTFDHRSKDYADWGVEKPTHYAHLLGQASEDPYSAKIWLHQYKPATGGDRKFTEFDHNHRDGIVSLLVRAGYVATEHRDAALDDNIETDPSVNWTEFYSQLQDTGEVGYEAGDIMAIHPDEVHRLTAVLPGALSLVVRPPVRRNFSVVFKGENGENPVVRADMPMVRNNLLDDLERL